MIALITKIHGIRFTDGTELRCPKPALVEVDYENDNTIAEIWIGWTKMADSPLQRRTHTWCGVAAARRATDQRRRCFLDFTIAKAVDRRLTEPTGHNFGHNDNRDGIDPRVEVVVTDQFSQ